ncbi:prenylated Rab receptor [Raphidocelis subcapitata]|uniref:PRA1 family protein n=1 Tax=Raphidocelis subcapitata TaxID=307507 RepID=A0A2V0NN99_9CHLO|nr:prenylated Rab receptor [Raphidocelis subcapitata]|eukprot:GBF89041.1 prenylated Rab receptor [Raphidocelis subcapitata]
MAAADVVAPAVAGSDPAAAQGPSNTTLAALYGVGARLREYGSSTFSQRKPWIELLDRTAFAKPANISEATARLRKNASYFRVNYLVVLMSSVGLGFLMHPSSLFVLAALLVGWVYVFAVRSGPLVINGRELSEREKVMSMSGLSFVIIFFLTNVASVVFSALVFGAALVAAHGATRVPDDLFVDDDSNQGLLAILTGAGQPTGVSNV